MATKTYVLLEHTKPSANVYIQVNRDQRVKITSRKLDRPFLQVGFVNREGKNKILRLKLSSEEIYQPEQIKLGILANEKFVPREYEAVTFRYGILTTKNETVQKFLDAHPQNEAFWIPDKDGNVGSCEEVLQPLFKEYNESVEIISSNKDLKRRIKAAAKIMDMDLGQAQELMIKLNGSFFKPPKTIEECQNQLADWLDNTDDAGVDDILREDNTADEDATLVVVKAMESGLISFDKEPGSVVKMKGKNTIKLKEVPNELGEHDKQRYFIEFLLSDAGRAVYDDLKREVNTQKKKAEVV